MIRFEELIGQELAASILQKAVLEERVMHAYLFTGPEGTGKLTTALAFAAALNCEDRQENGDSCGVCLQCRMMEGLAHPDVEIIYPDGTMTKIEQMREMRRAVSYVPVRGKWKVIIIEQADTMNEASSNCILKTLEEPPDYMVIVLLSRNPALVLPTIKSRCNQIRFYSAAAETLKNALVERFGASPEQAEFLAAYSEGRPGKAISILKNENFAPWRQKVVELAGKICSSDVRYALKLSEELLNIAEEIKDKNTPLRTVVKPVLDILVTWYRDLLDLSVRGESAQLINFDLRDTLMAFTGDAARISSAINALVWARRALDGNANVQLVSDVTLVRLTR